MVYYPEYDEGYKARSQGISWTDNPYEFGTIEELQWDEGWFASLEEEVKLLEKKQNP